jgi:hypothetical protein
VGWQRAELTPGERCRFNAIRATLFRGDNGGQGAGWKVEEFVGGGGFPLKHPRIHIFLIQDYDLTTPPPSLSPV